MKKLLTASAAIAFLLIVCCPVSGYAKRGLPEYVIEKSCGDNNTGGTRVLIAFATYYGSTYRIGDVIAEVLCAEGFRVDLKFARNVTQSELDDYDAVILGSPIYIEDWHTEALDFLETYAESLAAKPVAYYCANGLLGMNYDGKEELVEEHYTSPMYSRFPPIAPIDVKAFAGAVNYRIMKLKDWLLLHLMFMPPGDWTDYAGVVSWAYEMSGKLK